MNSDQGAQFTDPDYIKLLQSADIRMMPSKFYEEILINNAIRGDLGV
jgi:hypothetical protein